MARQIETVAVEAARRVALGTAEHGREKLEGPVAGIDCIKIAD